MSIRESQSESKRKPHKWYQLMFDWDAPEGGFGAFVSDLPFAPGDSLNRAPREREPFVRWSRSAWIGNRRDDPGDNMRDYLMNNEGVVIVSERVQTAMQEAQIGVDDVQFLPIHVRHYNGTEYPGYAVMNVLTRIEAIDRESCFLLEEDKSDELDSYTGKPRISSIGRPHVYASAFEGHDVIRPLDYPYLYVMSQRFARLWKKHKFTGANAREIRVTPGPAPPDFKSIRFEPAVIVD